MDKKITKDSTNKDTAAKPTTEVKKDKPAETLKEQPKDSTKTKDQTATKKDDKKTNEKKETKKTRIGFQVDPTLAENFKMVSYRTGIPFGQLYEEAMSDLIKKYSK